MTTTNHHPPVAIPQPADSSKTEPVREVIEELKKFRSVRRLDGLSLLDMIEEGRR